MAHCITCVIKPRTPLISMCIISFGSLCTQRKQAQVASLYMPLYGMLLDNMPRIYLKDLFPFTANTSNQASLHTISNVYLNKKVAFCIVLPGYHLHPHVSN